MNSKTNPMQLSVGRWFAENWEKWLFRIIGISIFAYALLQLAGGAVTDFAALFALAFFCWFYANISRFKRFKGLGFEAELWEDKQREAENLIDRLKVIVGIYSSELLIGKVKQGRWSDGSNWQEIWRLYEEISQQHGNLSAEIDMSETYQTIKSYFLFDAAYYDYEKIRLAIFHASSTVSEKIRSEFDQPIVDTTGHSARLEQKKSIRWEPPEKLMELAAIGKLTSTVLDWAETTKAQVKSMFDVDIALPEESLRSLRKLGEVEASPTLVVTNDLIELTKRNPH